MHDIVHTWAADWKVSPHAVLDLLGRIGVGYEPKQFVETEGWSETAIQNKLRMDCAKAGIYTWRNNVGALKDERGVPVRYGLCNDTPALNKKFKSADLIGIKKVLITQAMVGTMIGQFYSREVKEAKWVYTGAGREPAQLAWCNLVLSCGGDAAFSIGAI